VEQTSGFLAVLIDSDSSFALDEESISIEDEDLNSPDLKSGPVSPKPSNFNLMARGFC